MLVAAGLGGAFGLAMWKVGIWGLKAPFSDAALPPPYPAQFFRDRLHEWVGSLHPAIVLPLIVVAVVAVAAAGLRRGERADHYSLISVLWLLPLLALFGYVAGLTYPYYRFLNSTLALMLLTGMGAWIVSRLGLRYLKAAGAIVVATVVAALGFVLASGLSSWNGSDVSERWLQPDTRVALASMEAYVAREPADRPIVFVVNYQDDQKAYGWAKTYSNTARAGLDGAQALRSYIYFGKVSDFLAGRPTAGTDHTYSRVSRRFFQETEAGLRAHNAKPVAVMLQPFNQEPANSGAMTGFTDLTPGRCPETTEGCRAVVVDGKDTAPVDASAVAAARQAGSAEVQTLARTPGTFDDPGHLLRVIIGLLLLAVVPGAIASGWFELRSPADRIALVPGISIALSLFSGVVVLAVTRSPFGPVEAAASVVLALAVSSLLWLLARRRRAGKAIVVPFAHRALSLFSNRSFGFLMGAVFLAVLGDGIVQGALAKTIAFGGKAGFSLDEARSARHILALVLLTYLPYTFISPFMGVLIDRFDRRKLLVLANGARAAVVAVVGVVLLGGHLSDPFLIGALLLTLASTRLVLAIKSAGLPTVLGRRDLMQGNSISQAGSAVFQIAGAAIALAGTKVASAGIVVAAGGCVYAIGALVGARVRHLEERTPSVRFAEELRRMLRDIREGIGQVGRRSPAKLGLSSFLTLRALVSFVALVFALEVRQILGGGSSKQALLIAAAAGALGAALGFVSAQLLKDRVPPARLIVGSMVVAGLGTVAFGGVTRLVGLSVVAFVAALAYFMGKISADTIMQQSLPDQYRGRGFSLFDVAYNLAWIVPALVLFALWSSGRAKMLVIGAGVLFLAAAFGVAWWARRIGPDLRALERERVQDTELIDITGAGEDAGREGASRSSGDREEAPARD